MNPLMVEVRRQVETFWDGEVEWNVPMSRLSTLKVGGAALGVVRPTSIEGLRRLIEGLHHHAIPWWVVGRGSNILVPDEGLPGIVIVLGRNLSALEPMEALEPREAGKAASIRVEAGCSLARLVQWCVEHGLAGMEFASGIPGSVGGAIATNAGAWGGDMASVVLSVVVIDGQGLLAEKKREEMRFVYRQCQDIEKNVVVAAVFNLRHGDGEEIKRTCRELRERRGKTQPLQAASAGSFFKNPEGMAAGRLIEDAGLKGYRVGGATISPQHANFIVNAGNASASDIMMLMRKVQETVKGKTGVMLEPEVRILGR